MLSLPTCSDPGVPRCGLRCGEPAMETSSSRLRSQHRPGSLQVPGASPSTHQCLINTVPGVGGRELLSTGTAGAAAPGHRVSSHGMRAAAPGTWRSPGPVAAFYTVLKPLSSSMHKGPADPA